MIVSWGFHAEPDTTTGSHFIDLFQWTGTKDPAAALTVPSAIDFMKVHDWDQVRLDCHLLLRKAIERISELTHLPLPYPVESDFYAQMGAAALPRSNLVTLKDRLYDEFKLEVPLIQWQDQQFIRISVQAYNCQDDIDLLLEALKILLPQVAIN